MKRFAQAADAIAATSSKLEKIAILAQYLRSLGDDDLVASARFFGGNPLGALERPVAIGGRTIVTAARRVWGVDEAALGVAYRATGDLGDALGRFVRPSHDLGLFTADTLDAATFGALLAEAAAASGKAAGKRRAAICERILAACTDEGEARYAIKILTGELRIGLRESMVFDAIARAFEREPAAVRRAAMAAADVGSVALAARRDALGEIEIAYGVPVAFMLASPIAYGSSYRELGDGAWLVEDKYDGIRAQAHKHGDGLKLFSRTLSDASASFPEVIAALRACPGDFILDGEIVARSGDAILPFRYLQTRLQRKNPTDTLQRDVPVTFVAFDALAAGPNFLLDQPLVERRAQLATIVRQGDALSVAPWSTIEAGAPAQDVGERFDAARARGNEGLIFKRTDAPYVPGRRGKWWLKLKRELTTLDVVVVGVEWGHGKRKDVLSDYTFAVRESEGSERLLTIGKAYSGLTDAEIAGLTTWFLEHRMGMLNRYAFAVQPEIVIEVAFDIVQPSTLHESGFSLRFPRIARLRPDKRPADIDTLAAVERIYTAMLEREGVAR